MKSSVCSSRFAIKALVILISTCTAKASDNMLTPFTNPTGLLQNGLSSGLKDYLKKSPSLCKEWFKKQPTHYKIGMGLAAAGTTIFVAYKAHNYFGNRFASNEAKTKKKPLVTENENPLSPDQKLDILFPNTSSSKSLCFNLGIFNSLQAHPGNPISPTDMLHWLIKHRLNNKNICGYLRQLHIPEIKPCLLSNTLPLLCVNYDKAACPKSLQEILDSLFPSKRLVFENPQQRDAENQQRDHEKKAYLHGQLSNLINYSNDQETSEKAAQNYFALCSLYFTDAEIKDNIYSTLTSSNTHFSNKLKELMIANGKVSLESSSSSPARKSTEDQSTTFLSSDSSSSSSTSSSSSSSWEHPELPFAQALANQAAMLEQCAVQFMIKTFIDISAPHDIETQKTSCEQALRDVKPEKYHTYLKTTTYDYQAAQEGPGQKVPPIVYCYKTSKISFGKYLIDKAVACCSNTHEKRIILSNLRKQARTYECNEYYAYVDSHSDLL